MSFGWKEDRIVEFMSSHVELLDERGIDVQILGPRPFLGMGWMPAHLQPSWTQHVNDLVDLQCRSFPDRFIGACQLPHDVHASDASHCLAELDRCVGELGFVAAYVSPDPDGKRTAPGVHSPWWDPLYARCVELDVPVIIHGTANGDPRAADIPNNYQLNFLTEQYLAGQFLTRGHVFERHPQLRVLICHCGGALERFIATDDSHLGQPISSTTCSTTPAPTTSTSSRGDPPEGRQQHVLRCRDPGSAARPGPTPAARATT